MEREDVKGLAVALIDQGEIRQVAAFGLRNVEKRLPLTTGTVMYGASLTKPMVAYLALHLVDEGRLNLDASVATLLPRPLPDYDGYADLAADERWRLLTPRIILTHSTGLANFRRFEDDGKLRFHFDPGARYAYSGEGMRILQLVLEEGLGLDLEQETEKRIFRPFGMTRSSMSWKSEHAADAADTYSIDGAFIPHDRRPRFDAAGSLDASIDDAARLWAAVIRGDGLSAASRAELVRPQLPIRSARQFPTLTAGADARGPEVGLAAALGLVVYSDESGLSWFKGGHDDGTANFLLCQERARRCVVLLSNSVRAERIYPELVRFALGETKTPWWWEYGEQKD